MAKISIRLGMTLKMSTGGGFNMFKPEFEISGIETLDEGGSYNVEAVEHQVKTALQGVDYAYSEVEQKMIQIVETSEVVEKEEVITELRKDIAELKTQIGSMATSAAVESVASSEDTETKTTTVEADSVDEANDDGDEDDW